MAMRETDDDGKRIRVVEQQETGAGVLIRKHQELAAFLSEHRQRRKAAGRVGGAILQTERGQRFKMRYFSQRWNAVVDDIRAPYLMKAVAEDPELAQRWSRLIGATRPADGAIWRLLTEESWLAALETEELRQRCRAILHDSADRVDHWSLAENRSKAFLKRTGRAPRHRLTQQLPNSRRIVQADEMRTELEERRWRKLKRPMMMLTDVGI
jgi:hypothetical protein